MSRAYTDILTQLSRLGNQRAVLLAEQERKQKEKDFLAQELSQAGINLDDLEGEKQRLESEIKAIYAEAQRKVDQFEAQLIEARLKPARDGAPLPDTKPSEPVETGDMEIS